MQALEMRKATRIGKLGPGSADGPDLHPNTSELYRRKVERVADAFNDPVAKPEAAEAIRTLVETITLRPGEKRGEIEATLHGELGTVLEWIAAQAIGGTSIDIGGAPLG